MKLRSRVAAAMGLAQVRLLGQRVPVAARVNVTNRCHNRCAYCSFWQEESDELTADELAHLFGELAGLGCVRLSVSGGEPMLRADIDRVLASAVDAGLSVGLNSTGHRFHELRSVLSRVDLVKLSLDGPPERHDRLRGRPGAFDELLAAIGVLHHLRRPFTLTQTLTRQNLEDIPWVLDFARRQGGMVTFQPVTANNHSGRATAHLLPERAAWLEAVDRLVAAKRAEPALVRNSLGALEAVRAWPDFGQIRCAAGRAFVMIEADGRVVPCDRIDYQGPIPNLREGGLARALSRLPEVHCGGCGFLGALEINRMTSWRPDALRGVWRVLDVR